MERGEAVALKELLASIEYRPEAGTEGTLTDLSSNARLNLMLRTNVGLVQGFGQWLQGNRDGALEAFPAQELVRIADRKVPREWEERWQAALDDCGVDDGATDGSDRMVALKNHPIWDSLGEGAGGYDDSLGNPYPPFAFNSGMGVEDVDYEEAVALGVMDPQDDPLQPPDRGMNEGLASSVDGLDGDLAHVLSEGLSEFVHLVDGTLRFKNDDSLVTHRHLMISADRWLDRALRHDGRTALRFLEASCT